MLIHWWSPLQEEILEETAGLDGPLLTPAPPSTPRRHSEAKDANPWEASWGDLLSSQESDTEFDQDSSQSSSFGGGMAAPALQASADVQAATDAQTEATGTPLMASHNSLVPGLPLGAEAPVMTPSGIDLLFLTTQCN